MVIKPNTQMRKTMDSNGTPSVKHQTTMTNIKRKIKGERINKTNKNNEEYNSNKTSCISNSLKCK